MTTSPTKLPHDAIVWFEIPVRDLDAGITFYSTLLDAPMKRTEMEPKPVAFIPYAADGGVSGHLYTGKPSPDGCTVHLTLPGSLEDGIARCRAAGGTVLTDPVTIDSGRFAYANDPDGNSIGLFERAAR